MSTYAEFTGVNGVWVPVEGKPTKFTFADGEWIPVFIDTSTPEPEPEPEPEPNPDPDPDPIPGIIAELTAQSRAYGIPEGQTGFEHVGYRRLGQGLTVHTGNYTVGTSATRDAEGWVTVKNLDIRGKFIINSGVSKVRLLKSRIASTSALRVEAKGSNNDILIEDVEIDGLSSGADRAVGGSGITLRRVYIHHIVDGVRWGHRCRIEDSLICDHVEDARYHNDGMQSGSSNGDDPTSPNYNYALRTTFLNINVGRATITDPTKYTGPGGNSPVILKSDTGPIQNCFFEGCFFDGGNFLYVSNPAKDFSTGVINPSRNIKFRNCTFGNRYNQAGGYGNVAAPDPVHDQQIITGWSGNKQVDTLGRTFAPIELFRFMHYRIDTNGVYNRTYTEADLEARYGTWDGNWAQGGLVAPA